MKRRTRLALVAIVSSAALTLASACGSPGLGVSSWQPASVDAGGARTVRVVDGNGLREDVGAAQDSALRALSDNEWFHGDDDTNARLHVIGDRATLENDALASDSLYLRIDVLEWESAITESETDGVDQDGNDVTIVSDSVHAHAAIAVTVARGDGTLVLDGKELTGEHDDDGVDEDAALHDAMDDAVHQVTSELTPSERSDFVPFDDRDQAEKPILARAEDDGDVIGAIAAEDAYAAQHPSKGAPVYNRAVMLESQGNFSAALAGYDSALAHNPDAQLMGLIDDAKGDCIARLADSHALGLAQ